MEELKENRNIFTINGYLGRKWYFILGMAVALVNMILMTNFCKDVFIQVFQFAKTDEAYSIIGILTSGTISYEQLVVYVITSVFGIILSFINNKKRLTDIMGSEKHSYLAAAIITAASGTAIFLSTSTLLYYIVGFAITLCAFFMLFYRGKFSNAKNEQIQSEDCDVETRTVVSFWKRWFAYIIDAVFILGGTISIIAVTLPDEIFNLEDYSILIGLFLTLLYFGIMNSEICKGQTLGKSLIGVKVVNKNGNYLTLSQSLVRTLILIICLTIPYSFLFVLSYSTPNTTQNFLGIVSLTAGIIFDLLFLFNARTRQTLHDLAVGSYVINEDYNCKLTNNKTSTTPIILAIIPALLIAYPMLMANKILAEQLNNPDSNIYKNIEYIKNINNDLNAKITKIEKGKTDNGTKYFIIAFSTNINDKEFANRIKTYVEKNKNSEEKISEITIILHRTINLGNIVATKQKVYNFENNPNNMDK